MRRISKSLALVLIAAAVFSSLILIGCVPFGLAQTGTNESGILTSDATWTQTDSPYILTGPVAVNQGIMLTIEPGTTVNLGNYYLQVNGTLVAKGTTANQIQFNGGGSKGITFTALSSNWNEQTGSGCIIQNAIIEPSLHIPDGSVKIDHCTVSGIFDVGGSSIITNNDIKGGVSVEGSAVVSNNVISGTLSAWPGADVPVVSAISGSSQNALTTISNNVIHGGNPTFNEPSNIGISCDGHTSVVNNTVTDCEEGIRIYSSQTSGFPLIQRNSIFNNQAGIVIQASGNGNTQPTTSNSPLIEENLITHNTIGISVENYGGTTAPTIKENSIYLNSVNLSWDLPSNVDVTNNWWGTSDQQAINETIGDNKNDFNVGTANFVPFLTAPNPQAPILDTATLSPSLPPSTSSPTPAVPEFPTWLTLAAITTTLLSDSSGGFCRKKGWQVANAKKQKCTNNRGIFRGP